MPRITIQVLDGFERGKVYGDMSPPVTLGREEDNTIQLNDERVSRFHAKIQEDSGRVIITDLDSTNGTRVNGHPVQMRVLRVGDHISIGRSLLLFGSEGEIEEVLPKSSEPAAKRAPDSAEKKSSWFKFVGKGSSSDLRASIPIDTPPELFPSGPPEIPSGLKMLQAAQLSDLLAWVHEQISYTIQMAAEDESVRPSQMRIDSVTWQRMLKLEMQLAKYMRQVSYPDKAD
jgi:pSer/pThr/pTyr-binding forkhead associated (FHA) protein